MTAHYPLPSWIFVTSPTLSPADVRAANAELDSQCLMAQQRFFSGPKTRFRLIVLVDDTMNVRRTRFQSHRVRHGFFQATNQSSLNGFGPQTDTMGENKQTIFVLQLK